MPWTGKEFASRHNHKLSGKTATKAAGQANALLRKGVPEGEAIAIANKNAGSPKSREEHMAKRRSQGSTYRELGAEHGVSASTAHRTLKRGFSRMGSAS